MYTGDQIILHIRHLYLLQCAAMSSNGTSSKLYNSLIGWMVKSLVQGPLGACVTELKNILLHCAVSFSVCVGPASQTRLRFRLVGFIMCLWVL